MLSSDKTAPSRQRGYLAFPFDTESSNNEEAKQINNRNINPLEKLLAVFKVASSCLKWSDIIGSLAFKL